MFRKFCTTEQSHLKISTIITETLSDAMDACADRISAYLRERKGPTIAVLQGSLSSKEWRCALPILHEIPIVTMPPNTKDYSFPALNWQVFASECMVKRFLDFPEWLQDRLRCARHAHIPLGNLDMDVTTMMTDVLFARTLKQNHHVLWTNTWCRPDVGMTCPEEQYVSNDRPKSPIINNSGAYRSICFELEVKGLTVCALLNSTALDTWENFSTSLTQKNDRNYSLEGFLLHGTNWKNRRSLLSSNTVGSGATAHSGSCIGSFNLLKVMVRNWMSDVERTSTPLADALLINLYRYLCGDGDGLLYDPMLHVWISHLMTVLFERLISELGHLGVKIIYADFNRIILDTDKLDNNAAHEYINFVLLAIKRKELFSFMSIHPIKVWEELLWLDRENWGGLESIARANTGSKDNINISSPACETGVESEIEHEMNADILHTLELSHHDETLSRSNDYDSDGVIGADSGNDVVETTDYAWLADILSNQSGTSSSSELDLNHVGPNVVENRQQKTSEECNVHDQKYAMSFQKKISLSEENENFVYPCDEIYKVFLVSILR
jgi:DNA polymerase epsilon subunit 1